MTLAEHAVSPAVDDWIEWDGGARPVPAVARVEVIQTARHAHGLALAFNWGAGGDDAVLFWRFQHRPEAAR